MVHLSLVSTVVEAGKQQQYKAAPKHCELLGTTVRVCPGRHKHYVDQTHIITNGTQKNMFGTGGGGRAGVDSIRCSHNFCTPRLIESGAVDARCIYVGSQQQLSSHASRLCESNVWLGIL